MFLPSQNNQKRKKIAKSFLVLVSFCLSAAVLIPVALSPSVVYAQRPDLGDFGTDNVNPALGFPDTGESPAPTLNDQQLDSIRAEAAKIEGEVRGTTATTPAQPAQETKVGQENTLQNLIADVVGWVLTPFFQLEGWLIAVLTRALLAIVKYNGFIASPPVQIGWTLVRDVVNLFFVVILLIIALGTILKIESYSFKRLLPKVLIMAILVNFSLVIAGLILDFGQVVMMTFVSAFAAVTGEGNLIAALHIDKIIFYHKGEGTPMNLLVTLIVMVIMLAITIIVLLVMVVVFAIRIVMLWLLLVLAPLPYLLTAWGGKRAQNYYQQWWDEFIKYVVVGPVLAFFLWLALAIGTSTELLDKNSTPTDFNVNATAGLESSNPLTAIADPKELTTFIIVICLLMASLMITQQLGVAGGSFAGNMAGKIRSAGMAALTKPARFAGGLGSGLGKWAARRADDLQAGFIQKPLMQLALKTPGLGFLARKAGLDRAVEAGGIKFRTVPEAFKKFRARREEQAVNDSEAAARDIFHRVAGFIPGVEGEETEFTSIEHDALVREAKKEFEGSEDADEVVGRLLKYLDKNGHAVSGREHNVQAALETLTKNHDFNEALKSSTLMDLPAFKEHFKANPENRLAVNLENSKALLTGLFGEKEGARVGVKLGQIGLQNNDLWLKGLAQRKGDDYAFLDSEEAANRAAAYGVKKDPRFLARTFQSQDVLTEQVDDLGASAHGPVHSTGSMILPLISGGIMAQISHMKPETRQRLTESLDELVGHFSPLIRDGSISGEQAEELEEFLANIVNVRTGASKSDSNYAKSIGDVENFVNSTEKGYYDSKKAFRTAVRHNASHPDQAILDADGSLTVDGINTGAVGRNKSLQRAVYEAAGQSLINSPNDAVAARSAAEAAVRAYRSAATARAAAATGPAPAPAAATPPPGPMPLPAIDQRKYDQTAALAQRAKAMGVDDYTVMPEYQEAEHLSPNDLKQYERAQKLPKAMSFNKFGRGQSRMMALDFKELGLDFLKDEKGGFRRGVTFADLTSDQGTELALQAQEALDHRLAQIGASKDRLKFNPEMNDEGLASEIKSETNQVGKGKGNAERLNSLKQIQNIRAAKARLNKPEELGAIALANTGAGKEGIQHEYAHIDLTQIDKDSSLQTSMWKNQSEEYRTKRQTELEKEHGHQMGEVELANEDSARRLAEGKMSTEELKTIKERADKQGVTLETPIRLKPEVEVEEGALAQIPSEWRVSVDRLMNKFKRKPKPTKVPIKSEDVSASPEVRFAVRQNTHQQNIDKAQQRQQQLQQTVAGASKLVTQRSADYKQTQDETRRAEQALSYEKSMQASRRQQVDRLSKLTQQAEAAPDKMVEVDGVRRTAQDLRAEARGHTADYEKGGKDVTEAERSLAEKRQTEGTARQNLTDQIKTTEGHQQRLDQTQKAIKVVGNIQRAEATLEADRSGQLPGGGHLDAKTKEAIHKDLEQWNDELAAEMSVASSMIHKPVVKAKEGEKERPAAQPTARPRASAQAQPTAAAPRPAGRSKEEVVDDGEEIEKEEERAKKAVAKGDSSGFAAALNAIADRLDKVVEKLDKTPGIDKEVIASLKKGINESRTPAMPDGGSRLDPQSQLGRLSDLKTVALDQVKEIRKLTGKRNYYPPKKSDDT
ncbi:MAG: hypothetical protein A2744_02610 [Candidatus Buchananbacteria bacterium RIFCSPHIGHO2_01_FULL_44_11]|uniref:Uncharacterized protein n=1 Tax=Candidatus Buchananbacteria bacterium RIFCSPHIGHO2_01_FULL_44_11 TaxID=1797535 RepID=A0A1G1Y0B0_9BACT|nr:MAG: hypothetical protein A2744_02610 [Candidatus Buchananbacteria bacterium RIFCSPHIGHO2_01_FULL_44_11]